MEEDEDEAVSQEIISEKIPNHWIEQKDRERERESQSRLNMWSLYKSVPKCILILLDT